MDDDEGGVMEEAEFDEQEYADHCRTMAWLHEHGLIAAPRDCGEDGCQAWKMTGTGGVMTDDSRDVTVRVRGTTPVPTPLTYGRLKTLFDQWFDESEQARRDEAMRWSREFASRSILPPVDPTINGSP